jgi:hydroxymethylbilane synthase
LIRIGTRGSELALRQTKTVAGLLAARGHATELVVIQTRGDASDRPFRELEGKAFFTKELDEALLARQVDLAIHSLKDLPTDDPTGLATTSVLPARGPRATLLLRVAPAAGAPLLGGMRVGTSSAAARGAARRRIRRHRGRPAAATCRRAWRGSGAASTTRSCSRRPSRRLGLDLSGLSVHPLEPPRFLPAPGQGVLAARYRADDARSPAEALRPLVATSRPRVLAPSGSCSRARRRLQPPARDARAAARRDDRAAGVPRTRRRDRARGGARPDGGRGGRRRGARAGRRATVVVTRRRGSTTSSAPRRRRRIPRRVAAGDPLRRAAGRRRAASPPPRPPPLTSSPSRAARRCGRRPRGRVAPPPLRTVAGGRRRRPRAP